MKYIIATMLVASASAIKISSFGDDCVWECNPKGSGSPADQWKSYVQKEWTEPFDDKWTYE